MTTEKKAKPADDRLTLVFDTELMRPACVLLQVVGGCAENNGFLQMTFVSATWLDAPTKGMKRVSGTRDEWKQISTLRKAADL